MQESLVQMDVPPSRVVRFGVFELDLRAKELRKNGLKIKLRGQPFQVLAMLIERPGEVVTREEIQKKLWPDGTFVDFDHSLNTAVNKIREVLGDSAESHRFVETLARRGYRFIAPVDKPIATRDSGTGPPIVPTEETSVLLTSARPSHKRKLAISLLALGVMFVGLGIWWWTWWYPEKPAARHGEMTVRQLTTNSHENGVLSASISPDGNYLAYVDKFGIHLRRIETGEIYLLPIPKAVPWGSLSWFPDGSKLLIGGHSGQPPDWSLWVISILGGAPRKLRDGTGTGIVSPDGSLIAFLSWEDRPEIWVMDSNGENARRVRTTSKDEEVSDLKWSPDGQRLAYTRAAAWSAYSPAREPWGVVESCDLDGGEVTTILSDPNRFVPSFCWLPNGRLIYSRNEQPKRTPYGQIETNLWEVQADPKSARPSGQPRRLTQWPGSGLFSLSITEDGKRLAVVRGSNQNDVYVAELAGNGKQVEAPRRLTLDESSEWPTGWTADSRAVIFESDRNGNLDIFKQDIDQTTAEALITGPQDEGGTELSPDNLSLLYLVGLPGPSSRRLMRRPIDGGPPQLLLKGAEIFTYDCAGAAPGRCVVSEQVGERIIFSEFDLAQSGRRKILEFQAKKGVDPIGWGLSPDGSCLAIMAIDKGPWQVRFYSLRGELTREVPLQNVTALGSVTWSADGKGIYLAVGNSENESVLLYAGLDGHTEVLWKPSFFMFGAMPSPDGKHLAIAASSVQANVWMLENF